MISTGNQQKNVNDKKKATDIYRNPFWDSNAVFSAVQMLK